MVARPCRPAAADAVRIDEHESVDTSVGEGHGPAPGVRKRLDARAESGPGAVPVAVQRQRARARRGTSPAGAVPAPARHGEEGCLDAQRPSVASDAQLPAFAVAAASRDGRGLEDTDAQRAGVLEQEDVEAPPIDEQARRPLFAALAELAVPCDEDALQALESGCRDGLVSADERQERKHAGRERLPQPGPRECRALDERDVEAELCEARRERAARRPAADHEHVRGQALAHAASSLRPVRRRRLARGAGQPQVRLEAVVQPAADVVARGPAAMDHLVMAAAPAQVARPAAVARLLTVDVPLGQPLRPGARGRRPRTRSPSPPRSRRRSGGTRTARPRPRRRGSPRPRRTDRAGACRGRSRAAR